MIERKPDPREGKLPKWAQQEIARLRDAATSADKRVAAAEERAEEARLKTKPDEVNTLWAPRYNEDIGLGNGERIRFLLGKQSRTWDNVDVKVTSHDPELLEVHAGRSMLVHLNSSNLIYLRLRPY